MLMLFGKLGSAENDVDDVKFLTTEKVENKIETLKVILPISVDKFFESFIVEDGPYSIR